MLKNWYLVNIADTFFSNHPQLKGTVSRLLNCHSKENVFFGLRGHFKLVEVSKNFFVATKFIPQILCDLMWNPKKILNYIDCTMIDVGK